MRDSGCLCLFYLLFLMFLRVTQTEELAKDAVDKVIENELTSKLAEDLLQSVERKFQVDLERSVDMVLVKIKVLLQNGTMHIQDRLLQLQRELLAMRKTNADEVDKCLVDHQNSTTKLAEKALHQMVVCGYALIGHDPDQAVKKVMALKNMIKEGLKPLHVQKSEVYDLLRVCGHDHDTLKKVIKCVISKSPTIKSAMMDITGKLIDGIVTLTKLMAHGAMHEACLIEVIKTTEDEAFLLVDNIKRCVYGSSNFADEVDKFLAENNATVLDVGDRVGHKVESKNKEDENNKSEKEAKEILRRVLNDPDVDAVNDGLKEKLKKLEKDLELNQLQLNDVINNDKI